MLCGGRGRNRTAMYSGAGAPVRWPQLNL